MKEYLYNITIKNEAESFLKIAEKYSFDYKVFSDEASDTPNYALAAAYFNHKDILKWLLKNCDFDINSRNVKNETILHFGKISFIYFPLYHSIMLLKFSIEAIMNGNKEIVEYLLNIIVSNEIL